MPKNSQDARVLYRKYRPASFKDVSGQDHIVSVLEAAIKDGNMSHAYLFSGSRGTGKTSVARIFAKAIGTSVNDLHELDAASQNGVDDIRSLTDSVNTYPFDSKYKVYILDEVHMFSKSAWNAFLKTLEEPPAHVIFILATTELDKVPDTVFSRCQTFEFRRPGEMVLREFAERAAKAEGFSLSPDAAELVALMGDGSFRDTLSILQKVLSFTDGKKVSAEDVETVTGAPRKSLVDDFVRGVSEGDVSKSISVLNEASSLNLEMKVFSLLVLHRARAVLLMRFDKSSKEALEERFSAEELAFLESMAGDKGSKLNAAALAELLSAHMATGRTAIPALPLELALMRIMEEVKR